MINTKNEITKDVSNEALSTFTLDLLRQVTGIKAHDLRESTTFVEINLESLAITAFVSRLEQYFPKISKTFIFDCRNLIDVNNYLEKQHSEDVKKLLRNQNLNVKERSVQQHNNTKQDTECVSDWPEIEPISNISVNEEKDAVAIIGMHGQFPGSDTLEEFWENLYQGKHAITEISPERWPLDNFFEEGTDSRKTGLSYAKWGGFLSDVDKFDAQFFGISAREADQMDPQERVFLECAWHAMEHAALFGERAENLKKGRSYDIGVFIGLTTNTYNLLTTDNWRQGGTDIPASVPWSAANRVSFALNLSGPSLAVDTACSSSLIALHLACESILKGECQAAITGGVNLYLHPAKYIQLCQLQMLSPTGRCHTFGEAADGFVPGEGCGAIVLKPLSMAKSNGDRILGVIRGTAVNHSGRTNGYTVPNAQSQSQLLQTALERFNLAPSSINYIEAHGTGTKLGDPIEFTGFTESFAGVTSTSPCGVGSVKSNIGHLESAAGIAGIIKVLLQLKNKCIPPSLGSRQLNPALDMTGSRFFVPQTPVAWQPDPETGLRRAGISSFGAGGTNGHVIIEQAPFIEKHFQADASIPLVFPVSARSNEQLLELIAELLRFIQSDSYKKILTSSFYSLAYVLQCGRQHHPFRFVTVAENNEELAKNLKIYLQQITHADAEFPPGIFTSHIRPDEETDRQEMAKDALTLAQLWSLGVKVNWQEMWVATPEIIDLPLYPFARDRHWINNDAETMSLPGGKGVAVAADNRDQTLSYSGREYFLCDHQINGKPIFPAAGYLNCFYRIIKDYALGEQLDFQNITWANPFRPDGLHTTSMIGKVSQEKDNLTLEFCSPNQKIIYCRTRCEAISAESIPPGDSLNIVRERCQQKIDAQQCYPLFDSLSMSYGPSFRCMESAWLGENEALVEVSLRAPSHEISADSVLEPGMLDSIFQSTFIFTLANISPVNHQFIPYSVKSFRVFKWLADRVIVHVRQRLRQKNDNWSVFDLTVFDADGQRLIEIDEFSFRSISHPVEKPTSQDEQHIMVYKPDWEEVLLSNQHHSAAATLLFDSSTELYDSICHTYPEFAEYLWLVLPGENFQLRNERIIELNANESVHLDLLWRMFIAEAGLPECMLFNSANFAKRRDQEGSWETVVGLDVSKNIIEILRSACLVTPSPRFHIQINNSSDTPDINHSFTASLAGFLRAVHQEIPTITANVIDVGPKAESYYFPQELFQARRAGVQEIKWDKGKRFLRHLNKVHIEPNQNSEQQMPSANDVIVITGGGGAIARAITDELIKAAGIKLALIGRSDESSVVSWVKQLRDKGAHVNYWQSDCTDSEQLAATLNSIRTTFGPISGVLHCAGILKDAFFLRQDPADWDQVLKVKILGALWLDELTQNDPLKWFVLCSALAGVRGNVGQSIYGLANAWLNAFAEQRSRDVESARRYGTTIALAWSLWNTSLGMQPPKSIVDRYAKKGLMALTEQEGVALFVNALKYPKTVLIPIKGQIKAIEEFMKTDFDSRQSQNLLQNKSQELVSDISAPSEPEKINGTAAIGAVETQSHAELERVLIDYLKNHLSKVTGTAIDRINPEVSLEAFGLDSILVMELNDLLEKDFPQIPKTLLFEARNLKLLANLLIEEHKSDADKVYLTNRLINLEPASPQTSNTEDITSVTEPAAQTKLIDSTTVTEPLFNPSYTQKNSKADQIAIVGIAGRYPGSSDLDELWEHLSSGHDLISEIPGRWSMQNDVGGEAPYAKWGGFIDNFDCFDPLFFGISPRDAERMDPQERLFLQTAWHTLENAGYTPETLSGNREQNSVRRRVGVIVGVMYGEYQLYGAGNDASTSLTNSSYASIANRVSYCLDLDGPSFAIDSMCSSSLTSISLACDYLRNGRSDAMIAGGVNLSIHPHKYRLLCELNFASTDGRCRSFGEGGDGYVPGEGVGAVLLKRLEDAQKDGDYIYAVIQGSDLGHGAKTSGYTVPNAEAQTEVIRRAFERSGIAPSRLSYVEAHGTGTGLGDPIEIRGLTKALATAFENDQQCAVGSIKSNIGHLESAAGIAALTKVLLQLHHDKLVPSIHSEILNSNIDFSKTPFFIQRELTEWKAEGQIPRVAAISSFGAGGSNAHLILEEYRHPVQASTVRRDKEIFVFSARTQAQLFKMIGNFIAYIDREMISSVDGSADFVTTQNFTITDVAMTLLKGRRHFRVRLALIAENFSQLGNTLQHFIEICGKSEPKNKISEVQAAGLFYGDVESQGTSPPLKTGDLDQYATYAQAWVSDKEGLVPENASEWRKVPLPGYEFLQNRYWFSTEQINTASESKHSETEQPQINEQNVVPLRPDVILERVSKGEMDREEARAYLEALSKQNDSRQQGK